MPEGKSAPYETSYRGDTHAFGNTEERLIRTVLGVRAREGDQPWDSSTGAGSVKEHRGDYHDAIHTKRNTVHLRVHNTFGGFNPGAVHGLLELSKRTLDRTEYVTWAAADFVPYWAQRISAEIVTADARRCLERLPGLRAQARQAELAHASARCRPPARPPCLLPPPVAERPKRERAAHGPVTLHTAC